MGCCLSGENKDLLSSSSKVSTKGEKEEETERTIFYYANGMYHLKRIKVQSKDKGKKLKHRCKRCYKNCHCNRSGYSITKTYMKDEEIDSFKHSEYNKLMYGNQEEQLNAHIFVSSKTELDNKLNETTRGNFYCIDYNDYTEKIEKDVMKDYIEYTTKVPIKKQVIKEREVDEYYYNKRPERYTSGMGIPLGFHETSRDSYGITGYVKSSIPQIRKVKEKYYDYEVIGYEDKYICKPITIDLSRKIRYYCVLKLRIFGCPKCDHEIVFL
jgi:hypothetical protein